MKPFTGPPLREYCVDESDYLLVSPGVVFPTIGQDNGFAARAAATKASGAYTYYDIFYICIVV